MHIPDISGETSCSFETPVYRAGTKTYLHGIQKKKPEPPSMRRRTTDDAHLCGTTLENNRAFVTSRIVLAYRMMSPFYIVRSVLRRALPPCLLYLGGKLTGGVTRAEADPDASFAAWTRRFRRWNVDIQGKHLLDVGGGRFARVALRMIAAGAASVRLVDLYALPTQDTRHSRLLRQDAERLGLDVDEACSRIDIRRSDFSCEHSMQDAATADLVFSASVLEHVRDPRTFLMNCLASLRPGGITLHNIDLRDHTRNRPFQMLTYSERTWERRLDPPGGYHLNRWRASQYVEAMKEAGFVDCASRAGLRDEDGLRAIWPHLDESFQRFAFDDLSILTMQVYGRR